mmetsp:Transcript_12637/g.38681  ORF Transcript_12637/g.38681 Transcript_12637/m.38681 type:complete len:222 (+) Transcript_12637:784-1449(+)
MMHAYSGFFSSIVEHLTTSFLYTGPMLMPETGILDVLRNSKSASSEPSVDACTYTPSPVLSTERRMEEKSFITSSLSSSSSSAHPGSCTTSSCVPATAFSRPSAAIFTPCAASISLWCRYCPLTLISRKGCGVSRARTFVTMGPSRPHTTIVSPSFNLPPDSTTSIVVPKPSMTFTSNTVHCSTSEYTNLSLRSFCGSCTSIMRRSGMPSPVIAEVGTNDK